MPRFLQDIPIALCARCEMKMAADDRVRDGDNPALLVHSKCRDDIDPYKLPAHPLEQIAVRWPRPDAQLRITGDVLSEELGPAWVIATESGDDIEVTE